LHRLGGTNPIFDSRNAAGIERDRDDNKILLFEFRIECLPDRQVEAATSP